MKAKPVKPGSGERVYSGSTQELTQDPQHDATEQFHFHKTGSEWEVYELTFRLNVHTEVTGEANWFGFCCKIIQLKIQVIYFCNVRQTCPKKMSLLTKLEYPYSTRPTERGQTQADITDMNKGLTLSISIPLSFQN